jgi:DNA-3-methyladenine glycosylase II
MKTTPAKNTTIALPYTPPFDWAFFLRYLASRAALGVEFIHDNVYRRPIEIEGSTGTITITHDASASQLLLTITGDATAHADRIIPRVRTIFDLDADLLSVHSVLGVDPVLAPLIARNPGLRVPGAWSPFELLVRTIVGQQVTVKAATTIMGRIASRFGMPIVLMGMDAPAYQFPTPAALSRANWDGIGMPGKRVAALQAAARAIDEGAILFPVPGEDTAAFRAGLLQLPGIGPWTVEYFAIRALRDSDAWPASDLVLKRAVEQGAIPEHWRPWRGYAAMHLWNGAAAGTKAID